MLDKPTTGAKIAASLRWLDRGMNVMDGRFLNPHVAGEVEMFFHDSPTSSQAHPHSHRPSQALLGLDFQALNARTADPNLAVDETWDLHLADLTDEIRWTLAALRREIATEAYRWGGSPTAFLPISWARWKELLAVTTKNAAKTRLARLEKLGLIEVLPCERGSWGSSLNGYRLGTGEGTQAFQAVMEARERCINRLKSSREAQIEAADTSLNPGHANPGAAPDHGTGLNEEMAKQGHPAPQTPPWPFAWRPRVMPGSRTAQNGHDNLA